MPTAKCTECGVVKDTREFRTRTDVTSGRRAQCKSCMNRIEREARERREAQAKK